MAARVHIITLSGPPAPFLFCFESVDTIVLVYLNFENMQIILLVVSGRLRQIIFLMLSTDTWLPACTSIECKGHDSNVES